MKPGPENSEEKAIDQNMSDEFEQGVAGFSGLKIVLRDINLDVKPGMKVCLVGPPGSGTSLFFLAMMGEAILSQGTLKMNGKVAYLS